MHKILKQMGVGAFVVYVIVGVVIAIGYGIYAYETFVDPRPRRRPSCASNMKQLGLSLKMYSNESLGEIFPSLSSEPGRLMWNVDPVFPDYSPDLAGYVCPDGKHRKTLLAGSKRDGYRAKLGVDASQFVDDHSYIYFGYALLDDEDVAAFAEFYKARMAEGLSVEGDIPLSAVKSVQWVPYDDSNESYYSEEFLESVRYGSLYQLKEGIERRILEEVLGNKVNDPGASARVQNMIPILIERPGNHKKASGGNVLFLDGHVEYIDFPGRWPMTERTIGIIEELDALGE